MRSAGLVPYIIISNIFNISGSGGNGSDDGVDKGNIAQDNQIAYNALENHVDMDHENHGAYMDHADDLALEFPVVVFAEEIVGSYESPFL
jgi:hypothetical protein